MKYRVACYHTAEVISSRRFTCRPHAPRVRDVNETLAYDTETRPIPRPSCNSARPRCLIFATRRDRDRDLARPRPTRFSRHSTFSIVPKQWMITHSLMHLHCNNEAKSRAYWLVNDTLWYETEMRPIHLILSLRRDRDRHLPTFHETDTFGNYVLRPSRDRDVETETTSLPSVQPTSAVSGWIPTMDVLA